MNAMVEMNEVQWFACRMRPTVNPNRRTVVVEAEREAYRTRDGKLRVRSKTGTGHREFTHEVILRRAGFDVFLPVRKVWRIRNRFTGEKCRMPYPLLVDWMFVGWPLREPRWHELMDLNVVSGVLGTGGRPLPIARSDMMEIMAKFGGGRLAPAHHRYMRANVEYEVGDTVLVSDGVFEGFSAEVIDLASERARVVVDIFGRSTEMGIRPDALELVKRKAG